MPELGPREVAEPMICNRPLSVETPISVTLNALDRVLTIDFLQRP